MNSETFTCTELLSHVSQLAGKKVLVYGDIMLDRYLHGDTCRISPEAPVPVVQVETHRLLMGGAGNVARNIKSLQGEVYLLSACGQDSSAEALNAICKQQGINGHLHAVSGRKTTTKNRIIARHQQVLRFDEEDVAPLPAASQTEMFELLSSLISKHDVLILSDYGKGLINKEFMQSLQLLVAKCNPQLKIIIDPKTPNYDIYSRAFMLTPNAKEASEATGLPVSSPKEIKAAGKAMLQQLGSDNLLITLGAEGMALFCGQDVVWHIPTTAQEVFDVTGAGDTVIAVSSLCLAAGVPTLAACIIANYAAGIVVGEVGASAVSKEELEAAVAKHQTSLVSAW